jgi:ADP-ribose pyrophosphatase YjhB (NUDIX family)
MSLESSWLGHRESVRSPFESIKCFGGNGEMLRRLLHGAVCLFQDTRRLIWFFTKPETAGVHAIPLTPARKVVLVTLSYVRGWRLPGGGRARHEEAEVAELRELREEIGMYSHGVVQDVARFNHRPDHRKDRSTLFIVRDVAYRPKWSLRGQGGAGVRFRPFAN